MTGTIPRATASIIVLSAVVIPAIAGNEQPMPHPIITEIHFYVPNDASGDANRDGERHATGDEFIELFNPTAQTIRLEGYTLTNRLATADPETARGVRFTFPECSLEPGQIVVVFNGYDADIPGPVGTQDDAPTSTHVGFNDAMIFVIDPGGSNNAMANSADYLLLSDPEGNPVEAIVWGEPRPAPSDDIPIIHEVPKNPRGSMQRLFPGEQFKRHPSINKQPHSPGSLPGQTVEDDEE